MSKHLLFATAFLMACGISHADQPLRPEQEQLLAYYDARYDAAEQMLKVEFITPGYHSRIASGTMVHPTRESLYYAVALLQRGGGGDVQRARQIITAVLKLQETKAGLPAYGVWPWLKEEPLNEMDSVDLNWADFCGSAIAQLLVDHKSQLTPELQQTLKTSLRHAATAIRQRDVKPGYTNIAILGGGVCAIAGEILEDGALLEYGRQRLQNVVAYGQTIDGFTEYNSPPYGKVVIGECERILQLAKDDQVRSAAEHLRGTAWKMIAESFHPATHQWAGPHSRLSTRHLTTVMVGFLNSRTGLGLAPHPDAVSERPRGYAIVTPLRCTSKWLPRLTKPKSNDTQLRRTFVPKKGSSPAVVGTTWFSSDACLGSVSRSSFWTQRKPVIGYWNTDKDPAVVFRVRFLRDGEDFASMALRATQDRGRVLCALHSLQRRGAWHRTLDRPADGLFEARDLRVRLELVGKGVTARKIFGERFALRAGNHEVAVFPVPSAQSQFAGERLSWTSDNRDGAALVEGICYSGTTRKFDFNELLDVQIGFGMELQTIGAESSRRLPSLERQPGKVIASWQGRDRRSAPLLKIAVPNRRD